MKRTYFKKEKVAYVEEEEIEEDDSELHLAKLKPTPPYI